MDPTLTFELRDIHLPKPISWWPPAPGWWILLGLSILALVLIWTGRNIRRRYRVRVAALQEFKNLSEAFSQTQDVQALVNALSVLLRRISMSYVPRSDAAGLTGEKWLTFLDTRLCGQKREGRFRKGPGRVLIAAPYRPVNDVDGDALLGLCGAWIRALPPLAKEGRR